MTTAIEQKLHRYRLDTVFHDDGTSVTHKTYKTDVFSGERRAVVETRWTDKKELGAGCFGCVTLQEDSGGRRRAIKRVVRQPGIDYSMELKALSKVSDREDLFVRFLGWYDNRFFLFIAMEFIPYGDLSGYMGTQIAQSNTREITRQVLEGLAVLHERNICHRDLKPQNILIASPHPLWVKIADFGASKYLKGTQLRTRIGTPGYLAPELLGLFPRSRGSSSYTNAVDLWALGCIVYQMLTGWLPFGLSICTDSPDSQCAGLDSQPPQSFLQTDIALVQSFCLGKAPFPIERLQISRASEHATAFLKTLLVADPSSRSSASAALQTPWIIEAGCMTEIPLHPLYTMTSAVEVAKKNVYLEYEKSHQLPCKPPAERMAILGSLLDPVVGMEVAGEGGDTAQLVATLEGHTTTVDILLDRGVNIGAKDWGLAALVMAAYKGHTQSVRLLLDRGSIGKNGRIALVAAALGGHTDTLELLLDRSVDMGWGSEDRTMALLLATLGGPNNNIDLLLDDDAKLEVREMKSAIANNWTSPKDPIVRYAQSLAGMYTVLRALQPQSSMLRDHQETFENSQEEHAEGRGRSRPERSRLAMRIANKARLQEKMERKVRTLVFVTEVALPLSLCTSYFGREEFSTVVQFLTKSSTVTASITLLMSIPFYIRLRRRNSPKL